MRVHNALPDQRGLSKVSDSTSSFKNSPTLVYSITSNLFVSCLLTCLYRFIRSLRSFSASIKSEDALRHEAQQATINPMRAGCPSKIFRPFANLPPPPLSKREEDLSRSARISQDLYRTDFGTNDPNKIFNEISPRENSSDNASFVSTVVLRKENAIYSSTSASLPN